MHYIIRGTLSCQLKSLGSGTRFLHPGNTQIVYIKTDMKCNDGRIMCIQYGTAKHREFPLEDNVFPVHEVAVKLNGDVVFEYTTDKTEG